MFLEVIWKFVQEINVIQRKLAQGGKKNIKESGKTARSNRIYRDLLKFCETHPLRDNLMNYEQINALFISYIYIMVH